MFNVTAETAASISFQAARQKPARDDQPAGPDSFGSLVDRNSAADSTNDRPVAALPDLPAPPPQRRDDDIPSRADSQPTRNSDQPDNANNAKAPDRDDNVGKTDRADAPQSTKEADDPKNTKTDKTGKGEKADKKADKDAGVKTDKDAIKADTATDVTKLADTTATATSDKTDAPAIAVAAVALSIPTPAINPTIVAAPPTTAGATQPLAIAAAVIKAQAAATEVATSPKTAAPATADADAAAAATTKPSTQADEQFAALIASATPAAGKTGIKQAGRPIETATSAVTAIKADATDAKTDTPTAATMQNADAPVAAATPAVKDKGSDITTDTAKPQTAAAADATATQPAAHAHHATADVAVTAQAAPQPDLTPSVANPQQPQPLSAAAIAPAPVLTATAATSAPVPLNGLAVEIASSAQSGKSRFDIRLDPAELGRIDVRLDVDRHGQVTSHLTVEKPETLAMLRQDAPQLQRALEQAGLKTGDGGLQFSLRDQSQSGQQNNGQESGRNAQRLIVSEDDTIPAAAAGRSYGRMLGSNSGVDIRI